MRSQKPHILHIMMYICTHKWFEFINYIFHQNEKKNCKNNQALYSSQEFINYNI